MHAIEIGSTRYTTVYAMDEPGTGGACHRYDVEPSTPEGTTPDSPTPLFAFVHFQNGPVAEAGVNGCHHEDLLAIVIHRLQGFQAGPYACWENAAALTNLEQALNLLNSRTADRERRGVEGTSAV